MKTFTRYEKEQGELACRNLPDDVQDFINATDPLDIYECLEPDREFVEDTDEYQLVPYENFYYVRGVINADYLSFPEFRDLMTDYAKECKEV